VEPPAANGRELDVLWPAILDSLAPNQRVWLASSKPVMLAESTAVIAVPNEFTRTQLEGRLRTRLEDALSDSLNKPIRIAVTVDDPITKVSKVGRRRQPRPKPVAQPDRRPTLPPTPRRPRRSST
jgi:chromosomal replication initiator protein